MNFGVSGNGASCAKPTNCTTADPSNGNKCIACDSNYILKEDTIGSCIDRRLNDNGSSYDS